MGNSCNNCYRKVEGFLSNIFEKYGRLVARYPWVFIVCSLLTSGCLGIGLLGLSTEDDVEVVYTPKDSEASQDREYLFATYQDLSASNYSSRAQIGIGLSAEIIAKAKDGSDMLKATYIDALKRVYESIVNITVKSGTQSLDFNDLCARSHLGCVVVGSLLFTSSFQADLTNNAVSYPLYKHNIHGTVSLPYLFGDVTLTGNNVSSAKYARLRFQLQGDLDGSLEWLDGFISHMGSLTSDRLEIAYAHVNSLGEELDKNTTGDIIYVSLTFIMMITYSIVAISGGNCVSNRGFLAIAGVLSTAFGILAAIGFTAAVGVKFVAIVGIMPFLVLGVGVDDMFILLSGLAEVQHLDTVEERIGKTMGSGGLAITITSLTDLLAFCVGSVSVFLGVQNFCIYTGVAVLFCYINHITFLLGCMTLHERRVQTSRHSLTCMVTESRETMEKNNVSKMTIFCCSGSPPKTRDEVEGISERYPRMFLSRILQYPLVRIMALFVFGVYLFLAIWGAINTQEGLQLKDTVADSSYYYKYETFNSHLSFEHFVSFVFKDGVEYWDASVREKIDSLTSSAQTSSLIRDDVSVSWLADFASSPHFNDSSETAFVSALQTFLETSTSYANDVVIRNNAIFSTRVYVLTENLKTTNEQGHLMTSMRQEAEMSGMQVIAYAPLFLHYEQYTVILPQTLQTVGIALAAVVVATFLFMPHPLMMCYVLVTVVMIVVGLFGFMYFWGITLSSITMILLIMSVGFAIDYSIHTSHAFIQSDRPTRLEKMTKAIHMAAAPIVNAALSSFIGVLMMLLSKSYVFRTFFQVMLLVIILGFAHSTFFLPSLLSFIGPVGSSRKNKFDNLQPSSRRPNGHVPRRRNSLVYLPDVGSSRETNLNFSHPNLSFELNSSQEKFKIPRPKVISWREISIRPYIVDAGLNINESHPKLLEGHANIMF